jgi:hypothetical protein
VAEIVIRLDWNERGLREALREIVRQELDHASVERMEEIAINAFNALPMLAPYGVFLATGKVTQRKL